MKRDDLLELLERAWDSGLVFTGDAVRGGCSLDEATNGNPYRTNPLTGKRLADDPQDLTYVGDEPPVPMLIWCPECSVRHIDVGEFETKPHHTHSCQACGMTWRPALVPTVGVQFLPGFRDPTLKADK